MDKIKLTTDIIIGSFIFYMISITSCTMMSELSARGEYASAQGPSFATYSGLKRTIAVLPFEDNTELGRGKAGEAVADMILGVLTRSGRYIVVERSQLDQVLNEQALGQSGAVSMESAVEAGRIKGVQALVLGRLEALEHSFNRKDLDSKDKDWGISLMGSLGKAEVFCQVVDVATGEILFSDRASGSQVRPGFGFRNEDVDLKDEHSLDESVVGISLRKAANKLSEKIVYAVNNIRWYGKVIKIMQDKVYITPGKTCGVKVGTRFKIIPYSINDDPDEIETAPTIAEIQIDGFVGTQVSTAQIESGSGIQEGFLVIE